MSQQIRVTEDKDLLGRFGGEKFANVHAGQVYEVHEVSDTKDGVEARIRARKDADDGLGDAPYRRFRQGMYEFV